jgi:phospholipid/cholesterol/gamma-HCH transport system substrate-binding protein
MALHGLRPVLDPARPVRRLIIIGLLVAIVPWIVIGIVREANDDDTRDAYYVRAIFDHASTAVPGEDVKIAGVPVGVISDMNVTDDKKAAVTLRIDDENFIPWMTDASCTIRAQGLIGERFVECEPGSPAARRLPTIEEGDGKGERLLPVENTSSPVDIDLINNIMRLPYRERFSLLLSEFGTALAGRGEELNEVIHRANPALRETNEVIRILADQNRDLARLAENSDRVFRPLARDKERFANFVVKANETGEASAERRDDIRRGIELLPDFLGELEPLMADLEDFADQGTPLLADLGAAAPALGRLIEAQGTLADASRESFPSLGDALEVGRPALLRARPLIQDLGRLGKQLAPVSVDLDDLTKSLDQTGGVERLNELLFYAALSVNGFDEIGHYLRAGLVTNVCSTYATQIFGTCSANFYDAFAAAADSVEPRNAKAARQSGKGSVAPGGALLQDLLGTGSTPEGARARKGNLDVLRDRAREQSPGLGESEPMLDYLLGGEGR